MKGEWRYWELLDAIARLPCTQASRDAIEEIMKKMKAAKRAQKIWRIIWNSTTKK